jgi:BirA family biotin operon repressor/biotin-[acetyl-CoA-carboxylase] ligase
LNTLFIGQNFIELPAVESTNTFAAELLKTGPAEGTVVLTREQTAGRGQQGNSWYSQPGKNLTFSLILYPRGVPARDIFFLNKLFSVALHATLQSFLPQQKVEIKWPNDLLINNKKVAGMLVENQLSGMRLHTSIAGIGLNVNQENFPEETYGTATSMAREAGRTFDLRELLEDLLHQIEVRILAMRSGRRDAIERDYLNHLYGYQQNVRFQIQGQEEERYLAGVDQHGRLALQNGRKLEYYNIKEVKFCL